MRHLGSLEALKQIVEGAGFAVERVEDVDGGHAIHAAGGLVVKWYPEKGTIVFDGPRVLRKKVEAAWPKGGAESG